MTLIVIDLEATCSNDKSIPASEMEIIELAAVKLNANFQPVQLFDFIIKPVRHPVLTSFCTSLTTITQHDVDHAEPFPVVFEYFCRWLRNFENPVFCSWGAYDKKQLKQDLAFFGLSQEYPFSDEHINLKKLYGDQLSWPRSCGMSTALKREGIPLTGIHHRGRDDVLNIAKLVPVISSRGRIN